MIYGMAIGFASFAIISLMVVGLAIFVSSNDKPLNTSGRELWSEMDWKIHLWLAGETPHPNQPWTEAHFKLLHDMMASEQKKAGGLSFDPIEQPTVDVRMEALSLPSTSQPAI